MNKLTKIGASALCGSLAAISAANAGDLSVTGGVDMSWISLEGQNTGNPIGMGSNLTFKGSGELDNGWSVALSVAHANANAYSNTNVVVGVPGLGDIKIDQGGTGTGIDRMDDKTPTAWEEAYGWGLASGIVNVDGTAAGTTIEFTPSGTPDGLTARIAYSPDVGGGTNGDKTGSGTGTVQESGWDITLEASSDLTGVDGLSLYGGVASVDQDTDGAGVNGSEDSSTFGVTYAGGSFTIGYQWQEKDLGRATGATMYQNDGFGITFNVNDDLSIGYNHYESEQSNTTSNTTEADSFQIAYTMGGASFRFVEGSVENQNYSTAAGADLDGRVISVSLAF